MRSFFSNGSNEINCDYDNHDNTMSYAAIQIFVTINAINTMLIKYHHQVPLLLHLLLLLRNPGLPLLLLQGVSRIISVNTEEMTVDNGLCCCCRGPVEFYKEQ